MTNDLRNLLFSIFLSTLVLLAWQFFYESPRQAEMEQKQAIVQQAKVEQQEKIIEKSKQAFASNQNNDDSVAGKININSEQLLGSISLKGLRFDNLQLKSYKVTLANDSPLEQLFSDQGALGYFAEFGWVKDATDSSLAVPDKNSIWQCDNSELTSTNEVKCHWQSNDITYYLMISLDQNYMFTIKQMVENNSSNQIHLANYGRIFKASPEEKKFAILHEGAIGVFSDILKEETYEELSKTRQQIFTNTKGSWAGITHKYWLSALIPDSNIASKTNFIATNSLNDPKIDNFNVNFISNDIAINSGDRAVSVHHLFAGAKEDKILAKYGKEYNIELFDRAIDFGIFYFITKPLFWIISYFYSVLGNFGLAILAVTLALKLLLFPLASKSYRSMAKMKELQPKMEAIKAQYANDKIKFNQEVMALYKRENVNPAAGCLPLFIQIPIFFSLYKVIFISIEMRHAPFYGWIKDLSAEDPTSMWNLFGLLPWPPLGMLDIGAWPLIMGLTMYIQQRLSPQPTDQVQASVMKFMPIFLMFILYTLPSGLMIYWSFSNVLSILQQYTITKKYGAKT